MPLGAFGLDERCDDTEREDAFEEFLWKSSEFRSAGSDCRVRHDRTEKESNERGVVLIRLACLRQGLTFATRSKAGTGDMGMDRFKGSAKLYLNRWTWGRIK